MYMNSGKINFLEIDLAEKTLSFKQGSERALTTCFLLTKKCVRRKMGLHHAWEVLTSCDFPWIGFC